ncbi:DUF4097 family beta strand repeat-containing protein [Paucisalibacillus sp. EB02]|uniref:DUF4097 family beta strand repeat-containing protein n=1 Tax=Paucisalibacillus sp. EB02 TaxID=1347087 RepID=UPI0004B678C1|nr:DUF4097 family beta strand repeat-containing protein [Paucisalibacillus sp. EB02]
MGLMKSLFGVSRNTVKHEKSFDIQKVNDLIISVDIADVEVIVHDLPKVDIKFVSYEGGPGLEITETDNDLTIISKKERKGPTFIFGDIPKCYLKIFVPVDLANNWDVTTTSGVINASNLVATSFRMNATSGKINMSNLTSEKMNVTTTSGKIILKELKMGKLKFYANSGVLDIHSAYGDISGQVGSGSVLLSGVKGEELEVKAGSGKVVLKEVYMKSATVRANSGKVEAENFWAKTTIANVGSGKINIRDFRGSIKGNANSGNINISVSENSGVDLKAGSGNIHVEFQEFELNTIFDIKTGSGGIITNLPMRVEEREKHYLLGKAGDGDNLIRLRTGSGRVVLHTARSSLIKQGKGNKIIG